MIATTDVYSHAELITDLLRFCGTPGDRKLVKPKYSAT